MNNLIPVINKLQDIFNTVDNADELHLPQIAVVGSQSSGKSSVLENLVGYDFLPRGSGIVTRRPLILQLHYLPTTSSKSDFQVNVKGWGEFLHKPGQKFHDFQEIRREIERETDRLTGNNKGISHQPINLKIFSPDVLNLTLVDLPGITKLPVGDQPQDIEKQVNDLVMTYVENPNCIILAVTAANTDLANSDALKLAKRVDPYGQRTIGVCTKIDLMDAGTDALDILMGRVIKVNLGFIGVVNRSQMDINNGVSMKEARKQEQHYFKTHPVYSQVVAKSGTKYLSERLNSILLTHIKKCLPELRHRVNVQLQSKLSQLNSYGDPIMENVDKGSLLLQALTKFAFEYNAVIDGTSKYFPTTELTGGARVCYIFHETFGKTLDHVDPLGGLTLLDIRTAIRNATGARRALFVPEVSFELLVKKQIARLLQPSQRCAELVYEEMLIIIDQCISKDVQRFDGLSESLMSTVKALLRDGLKPTSTMIEQIIGMELAYINTNHPDFVGGQNAVSQIMERNSRENNTGSSNIRLTSNSRQQSSIFSYGHNNSNNNNNNGTYSSRVDSVNYENEMNIQAAANAKREVSNSCTLGGGDMGNSSKDERKQKSTLNLKTASTLSSCTTDEDCNFNAAAMSENKISNEPFIASTIDTTNKSSNNNNNDDDDDVYQQGNFGIARNNGDNASSYNKGWFNSWFGGNNKENNNTNNNQHIKHCESKVNYPFSNASYQYDEDMYTMMEFSQKERMETELIRSLITSYFCVVRKKIKDAVPKAIMLLLVNHVKDNLQSYLIRHIYKQEKVDTLMTENSHVKNERKKVQDMIAALQNASNAIKQLSF